MKTEKTIKEKNLNLIAAMGITAIVIILLSTSGCVGPPTPGNETNATGNAAVNETLRIAGPGDVVEVNYKGTFENGTVFDSGTLKFAVGAGKMIAGFDEAVAGMKEGETRSVTIPPEKAYGNYDPNKIQKIPRVRADPITMDIPLGSFKEVIGKDPVLNETYQTQRIPWPIRVVGIDNTTVKVKHEPAPGTVIDIGFGKVTAITVDENNLILTSNPAVGTKINTQSGPAIITSVDDMDITMDYNHPLAGKTLNFEIKLIKIKRWDKPEVNIFVMSYCPYGTMIEKGIIPVQELLGDKADINIKFVHYIMHGKKEADENTLQYCIDKEQKDKFWPYLACFLEKGDSPGCITKLGIDTNKLQNCIAAADKEFGISADLASGAQFPPYKVHAELSNQYGVGGSPTVVINDNKVQVNRDPESLKNAICDAFHTAKRPAECDQTLSTTTPSPGFGFTGGGGSSAGSCG